MGINEAVAAYMQKNPIPKTTRQAFRILDQMLSVEDKKAIVSRSESEFCDEQHFGLGLWIRNNWVYNDDDHCGLFAKSLAAPGYPVNEDSLSAEFLKRYYRHLKRQCKNNR